MTLNQCTKEELIFIINRAVGRHCFSEEQRQAEIDRYLSDVVYQRQQKILQDAKHWCEIATDCRRQYLDILALYEGKKLIDIPIDVVKKAEMLVKDAQYADRKWEECMRKVDN